MRRGILILLAIFLILPYSPWWMLWIILAIYGWFTADYNKSIYYGAALAIISWGIKLGVGYFIGGAILMDRIAAMLMGMGSSAVLIMISLMLAGVLGGLSSISGYHMKQLVNSFFPHTNSNK